MLESQQPAFPYMQAASWPRCSLCSRRGLNITHLVSGTTWSVLSSIPFTAWTMQTPLTSPVPVIRLPRGPDGLSRGFAPDGRRALLKPEVSETPESLIVHESRESQEQQARAILRERYLRSLLAMVGRQVSFTLHEGVHVTAQFGATDLDVANFYVSQLQTPIGVQAEALLRCSDIIAYNFKL
ncbi:gem-associated protein 7 isoform X1 [Phyllostomus hastatus]|uniref:gem-associated protein 7 isoform X1 n=2 Tax=Phyllostomus hastatus TaxID=9423 RepID=UPI001E68472D|nr:gem-associated protein 7 isoform X1 [Phyllostomus hastatus]